MKTKIITVVGLVLAIAGAVIGAVSGALPGAPLIGMAVVLLGAGAAIYGIWKNRNPEKPMWVTITSIVLVAVGALLAGISGFNDTDMFKEILTAVLSIIASLIGVLFPKCTPKAKKLAKK